MNAAQSDRADHAGQASAASGRTALERRLAALRGDARPRGLDARALAALAANPGCHRRAVLDAAGVDKGEVAGRLGDRPAFGRSPFAISRGLAFERRVVADGGAVLVGLLARELGLPAPDDPPACPDLLAKEGPAVRTARTREVLGAAAANGPGGGGRDGGGWDGGGWTVLLHPMLRLDVAGSPAYLEPDAIILRPDGGWTVAEIKSFPILDGTADPEKVGAAVRQAAVYVLALRELPALPGGSADGADAARAVGAAADDRAMLVCPRDFGNEPTASLVETRRATAVTRRQLDRMTRIEQLLAELPEHAVLDPGAEPERLAASVDAVPAAYSPECLAACELAFHCRAETRSRGEVALLGRGVRGELGALRTVGEVLSATTGAEARTPDAVPPATRPAAGLSAADTSAAPDTSAAAGGPAAEAAALLARAARLRAEALASMPTRRATDAVPDATGPAPAPTGAPSGDLASADAAAAVRASADAPDAAPARAGSAADPVGTDADADAERSCR